MFLLVGLKGAKALGECFDEVSVSSVLLRFLSYPLPFSHGPRLTLLLPNVWLEDLLYYHQIAVLIPHMLWLDAHESDGML